MLRDWLFSSYGEKQTFRRLMVSERQRQRVLNVAKVSCCSCGMDMEKTAPMTHHCHLSGTIFGVALSQCNLRARTTNLLPVFFHNLWRYGAHHILKHLKLKVGEDCLQLPKLMKHTFHSASSYLWALTKSNRGDWLICVNLFASSTAINLFFKV